MWVFKWVRTNFFAHDCFYTVKRFYLLLYNNTYSISALFIRLYAVKWFQLLLSITNNSIKHSLFVYIQLNNQTVLFPSCPLQRYWVNTDTHAFYTPTPTEATWLFCFRAYQPFLGHLMNFKQFSFSISISFCLQTVKGQNSSISKILFKISTQFSFIWPIDRTLSGATTPGQNVLGSDSNERILRIPQSSSITEFSPSDCLVSYKVTRWEGELTPMQKCSQYNRYNRCILQPLPTGQTCRGGLIMI